MRDRIALYLQDSHSLQDSIKHVQYAESRGFEAVWQAESRLGRDALVPMAAYAATTRHIKIASGVVNHWGRNTAVLAAGFLTLDDLAPDRIICGLGSWWDPLARQVGIQRNKPLLAMREVVTALRDLFALKTVSFRGEFVRFEQVSLDVTQGRREARNIPLYIGATGPKLTKLTGEIADGAILNYLVSPQYNEGALAQLEAGAQVAGRALANVDRPQLVACSVDEDRAMALNRARKLVTKYLVLQPEVMRASGVHQELINEVQQVLPLPITDAHLEDAMRLVPDDVVQLLTASGTADEVRAKVREYVQYGATCPVLYPLGPDVRLMIDIFAHGYRQ